MKIVPPREVRYCVHGVKLDDGGWMIKVQTLYNTPFEKNKRTNNFV